MADVQRVSWMRSSALPGTGGSSLDHQSATSPGQCGRHRAAGGPRRSRRAHRDRPLGGPERRAPRAGARLAQRGPAQGRLPPRPDGAQAGRVPGLLRRLAAVVAHRGGRGDRRGAARSWRWTARRRGGVTIATRGWGRCIRSACGPASMACRSGRWPAPRNRTRSRRSPSS